MFTTKIGRHGQITLPQAILCSLDLNEGDRVLLVLDGNQIILRPLPQTLLELRGSVPVSKPQDFPAIRGQVITERHNKA